LRITADRDRSDRERLQPCDSFLTWPVRFFGSRVARPSMLEAEQPVGAWIVTGRVGPQTTILTNTAWMLQQARRGAAVLNTQEIEQVDPEALYPDPTIPDRNAVGPTAGSACRSGGSASA
jgi:hypothetical protein